MLIFNKLIDLVVKQENRDVKKRWLETIKEHSILFFI